MKNLNKIIVGVLAGVISLAGTAAAEESFFAPTFGDFASEFDGPERAMVLENGKVGMFTYQGDLLPVYQFPSEQEVAVTSPLLIDVAGGSDDELVFVSRNDQNVHTLRAYNGAGQLVASRTLSGEVFYDAVRALDGETFKENVLIATVDGDVSIYKANGNSFDKELVVNAGEAVAPTVSSSGWWIGLSYPQQSKVSYYNYDQGDWDFIRDVNLQHQVVYSLLMDTSRISYGVTRDNKLIAFSEVNGAMQPGFPVDLAGQPVGAPVYAEFDFENGGPEVIVPLANAKVDVFAVDGTSLGSDFVKGSFVSETRYVEDTIAGGIFGSIWGYSVKVAKGTGELVSSVYSRIMVELGLIDQPEFTAIDSGALVNDSGIFSGLNWVDVNGDGNLDVVLTSSTEVNRLYIGDGDGGFVAGPSSALVTDANQNGAVFADYDNDGNIDALTVSFGSNNGLYRGAGDGTFTRVTGNPVADEVGQSLGATWFDYDNDGKLDLFVSNLQQNELYHNEGGGEFTRVATGQLGTSSGNSYGSVAADYDNDGDQDIFVMNYGQPNFLFRNEGGGEFTRYLSGAISEDRENSFDAFWFDYDNDGFLDLYVVNYDQANSLYRNNGQGGFEKVTSGAIVTDSAESFSAATGDYDNDGDQDVYVANFDQANAFYRNNGDGTFARVLQSEIVIDAVPSTAVEWADFDADGDEDLLVLAYNSEHLFFENNAPAGNNWIGFELEGMVSNKSAVGAKIEVVAGGVTQVKSVAAGDVRNSQKGFVVNFGIGGAGSVTSAVVTWPTGVEEDLTGNVSVGQINTVVETVPDLPDISVHQGGSEVATGGEYNYGTVRVAQSLDAEFVIKNLGEATLNFTNQPVVLIEGANASEFEVVSYPQVSSLAPGAEVPFTVRLAPTRAGEKVAQIVIPSNDANENPYRINLTGSTGEVLSVDSISVDKTTIAADGQDTIKVTVLATTGSPSALNEARFLINHNWHSSNPKMGYIQWIDDEFVEFISTYGNEYLEIVEATRTDGPDTVTFEMTLSYSGISEDVIDNVVSVVLYEEGGYSTSWQPADESAYFDVTMDSATVAAAYNSTSVSPGAITVGETVDIVLTVDAPNEQHQDEVRVHVNHDWHGEGRPRYGLFMWRAGLGFLELGNPVNYGNDHLTLDIDNSTREVVGDQVIYTFKVTYDSLPEGHEAGLLGNVISAFVLENVDGENTYNSGWIPNGTFDVNP